MDGFNHIHQQLYCVVDGIDIFIVGWFVD